MTNNFKDLFIKALTPYVNVNITPAEANEIYLFIKDYSPNLENIKHISIDDEKVKSHYFFAERLGGRVGETIYQSHSNDFSRDGKGDTIIIKNLTRNKVLQVGKKVRSPYHKNMITILELGGERDGINQAVKFKTSGGAIVNSLKHAVLGLC